MYVCVSVVLLTEGLEIFIPSFLRDSQARIIACKSQCLHEWQAFPFPDAVRLFVRLTGVGFKARVSCVTHTDTVTENGEREKERHGVNVVNGPPSNCGQKNARRQSKWIFGHANQNGIRGKGHSLPPFHLPHDRWAHASRLRMALLLAYTCRAPDSRYLLRCGRCAGTVTGGHKCAHSQRPSQSAYSVCRVFA